MKRLALLTILLVVLASCGGFKRFKTHNHFIGEQYAVVVPERVVVFSEPSLNSEPKLLERPEEFVIEGIECGDRKIDGACPYTLDEKQMPKDIEELFYKVRFKSGETGYLNAVHIFYPELGRYLVARGPKYYFLRDDNVFEIKADYNVMWTIVIHSLDELGYVIALMRKEDGYIATKMQNDGQRRKQLSVLFSKKGDYIEIVVRGKSEFLMKYKGIDNQNYSQWSSDGNGSFNEYLLLDKVRNKFMNLRKSK